MRREHVNSEYGMQLALSHQKASAIVGIKMKMKVLD
jgi:hypothetical protein